MPPTPLPDTPGYFDRAAEYHVTFGRLPHWEQPGVVTFVTFRTWDSIPRDVLARWIADRDDWLRRHGRDPDRIGWDAACAQLGPAREQVFRRFLSDRWAADLDRCHGSCPLSRPDCAAVVSDSLRHFDGTRYVVFDFVVMPNHVHLLASFPETGAMRKQCESWKHYTAVRLNQVLGRSGRFWEEDSFDLLIRSAEQFDYYRRYIAENPSRAGLRPGEYVHYSRPPGDGGATARVTSNRSRSERTT